MLIGYLLIWCLLFVVLKYDLKQNTINSILRATCLTLITYIVLDINVKENFSRRKKMLVAKMLVLQKLVTQMIVTQILVVQDL